MTISPSAILAFAPVTGSTTPAREVEIGTALLATYEYALAALPLDHPARPVLRRLRKEVQHQLRDALEVAVLGGVPS